MKRMKWTVPLLTLFTFFAVAVSVTDVEAAACGTPPPPGPPHIAVIIWKGFVHDSISLALVPQYHIVAEPISSPRIDGIANMEGELEHRVRNSSEAALGYSLLAIEGECYHVSITAPNYNDYGFFPHGVSSDTFDIEPLDGFAGDLDGVRNGIFVHHYSMTYQRSVFRPEPRPPVEFVEP